jgi:hypothetical protein
MTLSPDNVPFLIPKESVDVRRDIFNLFKGFTGPFNIIPSSGMCKSAKTRSTHAVVSFAETSTDFPQIARALLLENPMAVFRRPDIDELFKFVSQSDE